MANWKCCGPVLSVRLHDGRLLGSSEEPHTTLRFRAGNGVRQRIVVGQADVPIGPSTGLELLGEITKGMASLA